MIERKQVSYWRLIRRLRLYWLAFPALFALVFGGVGIGFALQELTFTRSGITTEAEILDKRIERRRSSNNSDSTAYMVRYSFRPEGHIDTVSRNQSVSRRVYDSVTVGDFVPVTYVWGRPERSSIDRRHDLTGGIIFGSFGVVAILFMLGFGGWMIGRKLSIIRALRYGELREARVTGLRATNVQVNKRTQYVIDWRDAIGKEGTSMMGDPDRFDTAQPGQIIRVYVDPKTGRGWWEDQI